MWQLDCSRSLVVVSEFFIIAYIVSVLNRRIEMVPFPVVAVGCTELEISSVIRKHVHNPEERKIKITRVRADEVKGYTEAGVADNFFMDYYLIILGESVSKYVVAGLAKHIENCGGDGYFIENGVPYPFDFVPAELSKVYVDQYPSHPAR
jgi:hypothetical protein